MIFPGFYSLSRHFTMCTYSFYNLKITFKDWSQSFDSLFSTWPPALAKWCHWGPLSGSRYCVSSDGVGVARPSHRPGQEGWRAESRSCCPDSSGHRWVLPRMVGIPPRVFSLLLLHALLPTGWQWHVLAEYAVGTSRSGLTPLSFRSPSSPVRYTRKMLSLLA